MQNAIALPIPHQNSFPWSKPTKLPEGTWQPPRENSQRNTVTLHKISKGLNTPNQLVQSLYRLIGDGHRREYAVVDCNKLALQHQTTVSALKEQLRELEQAGWFHISPERRETRARDEIRIRWSDKALRMFSPSSEHNKALLCFRQAIKTYQSAKLLHECGDYSAAHTLSLQALYQGIRVALLWVGENYHPSPQDRGESLLDFFQSKILLKGLINSEWNSILRSIQRLEQERLATDYHDKDALLQPQPNLMIKNQSEWALQQVEQFLRVVLDLDDAYFAVIRHEDSRALNAPAWLQKKGH